MRLIDADALKEIISGNSYILRDSINSMNFGMFWDGIEQAIDESPTIDAVPVVRCKDCRYWDEHSQYGYDSKKGVYGNYCMIWTPDDDFYAAETPAEGFCYNGERKDNE